MLRSRNIPEVPVVFGLPRIHELELAAKAPVSIVTDQVSIRFAGDTHRLKLMSDQ
jgi:hypothetical protein